MYLLFIPTALAFVLILSVTIKEQIGSKPSAPILEQIAEREK